MPYGAGRRQSKLCDRDRPRPRVDSCRRGEERSNGEADIMHRRRTAVGAAARRRSSPSLPLIGTAAASVAILLLIQGTAGAIPRTRTTGGARLGRRQPSRHLSAPPSSLSTTTTAALASAFVGGGAPHRPPRPHRPGASSGPPPAAGVTFPHSASIPVPPPPLPRALGLLLASAPPRPTSTARAAVAAGRGHRRRVGPHLRGGAGRSTVAGAPSRRIWSPMMTRAHQPPGARPFSSRSPCVRTRAAAAHMSGDDHEFDGGGGTQEEEEEDSSDEDRGGNEGEGGDGGDGDGPTIASLDVDVIGDAFVDLLCFLDGDGDGGGGDSAAAEDDGDGASNLLLPVEAGGDALLDRPIVPMAGGSGINTATHLRSVLDMMGGTEVGVELQTVLNPDDEYGRILTDHSDEMGFNLVNRRRGVGEGGRGGSEAAAGSGSSTGHCVVIVTGAGGGAGGMERTFLTHRGCVDDFAAGDVDVAALIGTGGGGEGTTSPPPPSPGAPPRRHHHHHRHIHVAGYYSMPKFWNGRLREMLRAVREERNMNNNATTTTVSLVPQYDATQEWDGGILDLLLGEDGDCKGGCIDYLICSEAEARSITRCHRSTPTSSSERRNDDDGGELGDVANALHRRRRRRPPSTSSGAATELTTIVTRGERGAVALRGGRVVASRPAVPVEDPVDPTGAGDAFAAGFLCGLLRHRAAGHTATASFAAAAEARRGPELSDEAVDSSASVAVAADIDPEDLVFEGDDFDSIQEGLRWGCAVGTASVLSPGASTPSTRERIEKFLS